MPNANAVPAVRRKEWRDGCAELSSGFPVYVSIFALMAWSLVVAVHPQASALEPSAGGREVHSVLPGFAEAPNVAKPEHGSARDTRLTVGDRLKIMFLERIRAATAPDTPFSQSFIERTELTGEYIVQQDGQVGLGLLGATKLAEQTGLEAQRVLEDLYKSTFGKEARAVVSIVEREPIYILGAVTKPGTYDYSPGMTVLHAVARAGGQLFGGPGSFDYYEAVRESERYEQSLQKQRKLLAGIAVLEAERDGTQPVSPPRLIVLAGQKTADAMLAEADSIRKLNRDSRKNRLNALDATMAAASRELKTQSNRIAHIKTNVETKSERLQLMKGLAERKITNSVNYMQAASEFSDIQERLDEAIGQQSQVEDKRAQADIEKSRLMIDARLELERDIALSRDQLIQEEKSAAASEKLLGGSAVLQSQDVAGARRFECVILRREAEGLKEIPAQATASLQPGDLIRITNVRSDGSTSSIAPLDGFAGEPSARTVPDQAKNAVPLLR